jgi:hypothetical protein
VKSPEPDQEVIEVFQPVDLPDVLPDGMSAPNSSLPPDVSAILSAMDHGEDGETAVARGLNMAWKRYSRRMPEDVSRWIEQTVMGVITGDMAHATLDDAIGVPASSMDDAGLGRGNVLNIMLREGMLWMQPGTQKKLVDYHGVAHVFFNRRFWDEVTR